MRELIVACDAAVRGGADVHPGTAWLQDVTHQLGDDLLIHPVERLRERGHPEPTQRR